MCYATYKHIDRVLELAFVKRLHRKPNTFHVHFSEITITLNDVQELLGLQSIENDCTVVLLNISDVISLIVVALGVNTDVAKN